LQNLANKPLATELIDLATEFAKLFGDLMGAFLETIGQKAWQDQAQPVNFDQLPNFYDIYIPWFTDSSKQVPPAT